MDKGIVVETKDLTKSYDGVTVVDHLNLVFLTLVGDIKLAPVGAKAGGLDFVFLGDVGVLVLAAGGADEGFNLAIGAT